MITSKGLVKEMKEAGFLTIEELKDILEIECSKEEIEALVNRIKRDKDYIKFLNGEYKRCNVCKNLYIYECFHKHKEGLKNECRNCSNKNYKLKYSDKASVYRKRAYNKAKEEGKIDRNKINSTVRFSRMKKLTYKKIGKRLPDKIISELIEIKYNTFKDITIKDSIIIAMCFDKGEYIGNKNIINLLSKHS